MLFVVASAGILLTGFYWHIPDVGLFRIYFGSITLRFVCNATLALTVVGTVGVAIVLYTGVLDGRWVKSLARLRRIGSAVGSLTDAMRIYRSDRAVLLSTAVMSVGVHCLLAMGVYMVALGLPGPKLTVAEQFVVYPMSSVASTIPLPAGPFETMYVALSMNVNPKLGISLSQALIVALVFRLINILLAAIGFIYYLGARREVAEVMHEVEEESHAPPGASS